MRVWTVAALLAASLVFTGCPSAETVKRATLVTSEYEDAVRIKPEASAKYVRMTRGGVSRDGRTLRGVVDQVLIVRDQRGYVTDTVWVFRDLSGRYPTTSRLAIPLRDIELLPSLYPGMRTDSNRGIDLVESFHVTKEIPRIRQVPIMRDPCVEPPPPTPLDTCNCQPFQLGLALDLSCADREYNNFAIAALLRGSAFTDGNAAVSEGSLGIGFDALAGYRFGPHRQWLAGVTLSTGVATVDAGEISPTMTSLDGLETYLRPLVLATGRYYFVGFDKLPRTITPPLPPTDTKLRYANNVEIRCPDATPSKPDTLKPKVTPDTLAKRDTTRPATTTKAELHWVSPCDELIRGELDEYKWKYDSLEYEYKVLARNDEPAADLFGGCIKPYVYGELGVAIDARTQAAASMALNGDCSDCVAALRDANADGSLGVDWAVPLTFGFGVGLDIPISRSFDFEIDLGYRSIAVGDSYSLIGFSDVPDTRRFGQFQLRIGVIY